MSLTSTSENGITGNGTVKSGDQDLFSFGNVVANGGDVATICAENGTAYSFSYDVTGDRFDYFRYAFITTAEGYSVTRTDTNPGNTNTNVEGGAQTPSTTSTLLLKPPRRVAPTPPRRTFRRMPIKTTDHVCVTTTACLFRCQSQLRTPLVTVTPVRHPSPVRVMSFYHC